MELFVVKLEKGALQPYTGKDFPGMAETLPAAITLEDAQAVCETHYIKYFAVKQPPLTWKECNGKCHWVASVSS